MEVAPLEVVNDMDHHLRGVGEGAVVRVVGDDPGGAGLTEVKSFAFACGEGVGGRRCDGWVERWARISAWVMAAPRS